VSRQAREHFVGIENSQSHDFESDKLTRLLSKIANKTLFELTNNKLKVLKKNTVMCRGGVAKTLFPMKLIAWRRFYPLASCMIIVIQVHDGLATSVNAGKGGFWIRSQLECNFEPIQRLIAHSILLCYVKLS
jgi:hypothetical protein